MKLRISIYLARVSWFRRKNHKKKIQNKTKASYKVDFYAFFFCCRDCCKVGNSGITNLLRKHLCLKYFRKYYTTLNKKNCDECLSQPVSICMCPDQYKYINQIKQEGLFSEKFIYFFTKTKAENRSYGVFRDSLLT